MPFHLITAVVVAFFQVTGSHAADISFVSGTPEPEGGEWLARVNCNIRLEGQIVSGDAAKLEAVLERHKHDFPNDFDKLGAPRISNLCLNSPGGSLGEAIKMAELIRRDRDIHSEDAFPFVSTRLEADARCESACAVLFMSGTIDERESNAYPARSMHPTARLGFHAPALTLSDGSYSKDHVSKAFDLSMHSVAELLRILYVGEDPQRNLYEVGDRPWMASSLIETMLKTPSESMFYIDTVDKAGRWDVAVYPIRQHMLDYHAGYRACRNREAWKDSRASLRLRQNEYEWGMNLPLNKEPYRSEVWSVVQQLDAYGGEFCRITLFDSGEFEFVFSDQWQDGEPVNHGGPGERFALQIGSEALMFYHPDTILASLVPNPDESSPSPTFSAPPEPVDWAPRFGGTKVSLWDHNGSQMAWESKGSQRWIWYFNPRPALLEAGIAPGTLLFDGKMAGGVLSGTARRFSATCGELLYEVSDRPQGTRVVLEGDYQQRDDSCQPTTLQSDALVFEYTAASP